MWFVVFKTCKICNSVKKTKLFSRSGLSNICIDCSNVKRREKYENNEELRKKAIKDSTDFKKKKKAERDEINKKELEELEVKIGKDNKICKYCNKVKDKTRFRHFSKKRFDPCLLFYTVSIGIELVDRLG